MLNDEYGILRVYVHPKIRSELKSSVVGVSHSSLSKGARVKFAGSFVHDAERGWILENTTGHYGTRAYQMTLFLKVLQKQNYNLSGLSIKLWIPSNPKKPGSEEKDYTIKYENAESFLNRVQKSTREISVSLDGLSVSDESMADSAFGRGSQTAFRLVR